MRDLLWLASNSVDGQSVDEELDFFVNGELKFGIELLKQGGNDDKIEEQHVDRFGRNGKYASLGVRDYVAVDFRPMINDKPTNNVERREHHLVTVFFSDGFDYAIYYVGTSEETGKFRLQEQKEITLKGGALKGWVPF